MQHVTQKQIQHRWRINTGNDHINTGNDHINTVHSALSFLVCVNSTHGVSERVPCVLEIMRKFPSLFWEYILDKLLLKQLYQHSRLLVLLYVAPEGPAALYEVHFSSGSILGTREMQDLCGMLDFDCFGEIVLRGLKHTIAHYCFLFIALSEIVFSVMHLH